MGRATIRHADWEPYSRLLKLRATPRQLDELDDLAAEFGVTRAWLVRRGLARGLPLLVAELREAYAQGLRVPPAPDGRARDGRRRRGAPR